MDINNRRQLHETAKQRLNEARDGAKIAVIFAGLITGTSLLSYLLNLFLGWQISGSTGLSGLSFRSTLGTLQTMLPLLFNFLLLALGLGFTGAMLRISRGQYTSPKSMKIGFDRFWVLLRATLLQSLLYSAVAFAAFYLAQFVFLLSPLSNNFVTQATQMMESSNASPMALLEDPNLAAQMTRTLIPMFVLALIFFLAGAVPIFYHLRLVSYILIDKPGQGALLSMRESRKLMKGNCLRFFKVDLTMWWYYLAVILSMAVCYGDLLLSALGVSFSMPLQLVSSLFMAAYLVLLFLLTVFLEPHVQVVYGLCYDALRPQAPPSGGVVLGNIFNM